MLVIATILAILFIGVFVWISELQRQINVLRDQLSKVVDLCATDNQTMQKIADVVSKIEGRVAEIESITYSTQRLDRRTDVSNRYKQ